MTAQKGHGLELCLGLKLSPNLKLKEPDNLKKENKN